MDRHSSNLGPPTTGDSSRWVSDMTSRTIFGGFLVIDCCGPIMGSVRENRGNCRRCSNRTNEIAEIDGLIHTDGQGLERCLDMSWFEAPSHHSAARSDPSIEVVVFTPFAVVSCNYSSLCVFYLLTDQSETNQKFNTCLMAISITSSSTLLHHQSCYVLINLAISTSTYPVLIL